MRVFESLAALQQAVGTHLGYSDWKVVTQDTIDGFAEATGDRQWIHVDAKRAAGGPFGSTIAHGYLTLSLVPRLMRQIYEVRGVGMSVNYGADRLRFPSPVPVGSRIRAGVELLSVVETQGGHRMTTRVTVEREGSDKPACVVDAVSLLLP